MKVLEEDEARNRSVFWMIFQSQKKEEDDERRSGG